MGITGTNYRPIDNEGQLRETLLDLFDYIDHLPTIYDKALLAVLGLSYIQPFADGNKRTSRLVGNAMLFQAGYAPMSYRSVDDREYKIATVIFYEQNSVQAFKKLFIEQYEFSAKHYNLLR